MEKRNIALELISQGCPSDLAYRTASRLAVEARVAPAAPIGLRTCATEVRAANDGMDFSLRGTAAKYNTLSQDLGGFRERISPTCFRNSMKRGTDTVCLWNHDSGDPLARVSNGMLELDDSGDGLDFRCKLDQSNPIHQAHYSSVRRGDVRSMSFAFQAD